MVVAKGRLWESGLTRGAATLVRCPRQCAVHDPGGPLCCHGDGATCGRGGGFLGIRPALMPAGISSAPTPCDAEALGQMVSERSRAATDGAAEWSPGSGRPSPHFNWAYRDRSRRRHVLEQPFDRRAEVQGVEIGE